MATVINQTVNSASVINQAVGDGFATRQWGEATFLWSEGAGTWAIPFNFKNQAINLAAVINQSIA